MNEIQALTDVDFTNILLSIFIILIGFNKIVEIVGKTAKNLGKPIKWLENRETDHDLILANTKAIKDLAELHKKDTETSNEHDEKIRDDLSVFMEEVRNDIKKFTENRVRDREQSREIQKELTDSQVTLSESVREILEKIDTMQKNTNERFAQSEEKTNKRVQSDIKERIAQSYRLYNISKRITHMELEALEDLIDTYESFGGENSFVHSVVQKEMYTWEVTE